MLCTLYPKIGCCTGRALTQNRPDIMCRDDMEPQRIQKVSTAAFAFRIWLGAMCKYHDIAVLLEPKRKALQRVEKELAEIVAAMEVIVPSCNPCPPHREWN